MDEQIVIPKGGAKINCNNLVLLEGYVSELKYDKVTRKMTFMLESLSVNKARDLFSCKIACIASGTSAETIYRFIQDGDLVEVEARLRQGTTSKNIKLSVVHAKHTTAIMFDPNNAEIPLVKGDEDNG